MTVCGFGNTGGCHGALHRHTLHLWYDDGWRILRTEEPMKLEEALEQEGWRPLWTCPELEEIGELWRSL